MILGGVFVCAKCNAKQTVKPGRYLPKCSRCKEYGYWYQIDELSLYYNEQYIPSKIETLENNDWNEIFVKALYEINSKYPFDNFWSHTDEIEKDYPKYINDIMGFFDSIQNKYNEDLNQAHDNALEGYVAYHLEQEAERIQEQAEEEYDELEGDEMD